MSEEDHIDEFIRSQHARFAGKGKSFLDLAALWREDAAFYRTAPCDPGDLPTICALCDGPEGLLHHLVLYEEALQSITDAARELRMAVSGFRTRAERLR